MQLPFSKLPLSFTATPFSKLSSCQVPLFENLVGGSTPQQKEGAMHTMRREYTRTLN